MFKVRVFHKGRELPTEKLWETREMAESMMKNYKIFYHAQGAVNFTFDIVELPNQDNVRHKETEHKAGA